MNVNKQVGLHKLITGKDSVIVSDMIWNRIPGDAGQKKDTYAYLASSLGFATVHALNWSYTIPQSTMPRQCSRVQAHSKEVKESRQLSRLPFIFLILSNLRERNRRNVNSHVGWSYKSNFAIRAIWLHWPLTTECYNLYRLWTVFPMWKD